jgi:Outer membrane protein beta-barrel domain
MNTDCRHRQQAPLCCTQLPLMNKTFLLIIGIVILSHAASSQSHFGIKAGVNLANQVKTISIPQVPSTTQDTKPFVGYQFGMFYKAKLQERLWLSAEANFSVIGSSMTLVASDGNSYNTQEKLGYIELPFTLQYKIAKIYFGAGPSIGFKVFSKITNFENRSFDIPYYQTMDAGGNILAGYSVSKKLDVNVRYNHGFMNLYKDPGYAKAKNRFFNLSLLYTL